jgi:hypothetical protein
MNKTYGNRFATQEQQADGTWIVFNEVTGLPVGECVGDGERKIKIFPDYQSARSEVDFMYQYYHRLE